MPWPVLVDEFLTEEQVEATALPRVWHPSVVLDEAGTPFRDPSRTSSQRRAGPRDPIVVAAEKAVQRGAAVGMPINLRFAKGSWVRYDEGDVHGDAADLQRGREWTVLVCLRAAEEGGETHFPRLGRTVRLRPGQALVWPNYGADGKENPRMDHASLPVVRGRKVVVNLWFEL